MPQSIFRDRLINSIHYAVSEAKSIQDVDHAGLRGKFRELVAANLLMPMLPEGYSIGTGKISDQFGSISNETDLVIYNSSVLPSIMYSEKDGVFPLEASFYSIEVKSKSDATAIKDAIEKGRRLLQLSSPLVQPSATPNGTAINYPVVLTYFAFSSDLAGDRKTELERYAEHDSQWLTNPVIRAICVVGKGYWYYCSEPREWRFHPSSDEHDEVIDLVSGISNTLAKARLSIRIGLIGQYLMTERQISIIRGNT